MAGVDEQSRYIDVAGVRVHYREVGSGRPVLVLNGLGASIEMLRDFREALAPRRVLTFDVPGVGRSERWLRPAGMADYVDLTLSILERRGLDRVDVVGYSWGGVLAQALAARRPQRVRRLVLMNTGTGATTLPGHPLAPFMLINHARYLSPWLLKALAPMLYGGDLRNGTVSRSHLEDLWTAHPPTAFGYLGQLGALWGFSSLPKLRALPHRTLVLTGTDDPIAHHANSRLIGRLIRSATVEIIPEAGHLLPVTRPTLTAEVVGGFLDRDA